MDRPKILQVIPTDDYKVYVFYDNGEIKLYDCGWICQKSGLFEQLKDVSVFKELCTVMNGTLAWDISRQRDPANCIDICPDTVYEASVKIARDQIA